MPGTWGHPAESEVPWAQAWPSRPLGNRRPFPRPDRGERSPAPPERPTPPHAFRDPRVRRGYADRPPYSGSPAWEGLATESARPASDAVPCWWNRAPAAPLPAWECRTAVRSAHRTPPARFPKAARGYEIPRERA